MTHLHTPTFANLVEYFWLVPSSADSPQMTSTYSEIIENFLYLYAKSSKSKFNPLLSLIYLYYYFLLSSFKNCEQLFLPKVHPTKPFFKVFLLPIRNPPFSVLGLEKIIKAYTFIPPFISFFLFRVLFDQNFSKILSLADILQN